MNHGRETEDFLFFVLHSFSRVNTVNMNAASLGISLFYKACVVSTDIINLIARVGKDPRHYIMHKML